MCKTLIVDNYDSFTYNLYQYMGEICGTEPTVIFNDESFNSINLNDFDCILISPGPGTPARDSDVGISKQIILEAEVPLLGVCLGHQCLAHMYGLEIIHAPEPMHGRITIINHNNQNVFKGLPTELAIVRYHSLIVKNVKYPFELTAWDQHGIVHGIQHMHRPLYGVQFHPESICTQVGKDMLQNFHDIAITYKSQKQFQKLSKPEIIHQ